MVTEMMEYCNNHFLISVENIEITFVDTTGVYTIEGDFAETYLAGQYIYISGSILNDGAYKISIVATGVLTVVELVLAEVSGDTDLFGCKVPKAFITLSSEIDTWNTDNAAKAGTAAEKIDDYQINFFATVSSGGGWIKAFESRLIQYKAAFDDVEKYLSRFRYGRCC